MLTSRPLCTPLVTACMLAIALATLVALPSLLHPQIVSAQCTTTTAGCTNPFPTGFGAGACGSSYFACGSSTVGGCGSAYYSCGSSTIYNGGSGCQQVLFQASGCVPTSTTSGGATCAGQTLTAGQQCSNGVISCQVGVSCSSAGGGTNITHCPSTMTTPQCTAATTTSTSPATTAATAPQTAAAHASGPVSCPAGGYAPSASQCTGGTSTVSASTNSSLGTTGLAGPQTGFQVSLASGWNLISGPDGTTIPGSGLLTFQAGDTNYEQIAAGTPMKAGLGYWVFLPAATQITLAASSAPTNTTVNLPAGQPVMIGNPGNTPATVTGADKIFVLTPGSNTYANGNQLQPGQGAWALSANGGQVTIANSPASPSTSISTPGS